MDQYSTQHYVILKCLVRHKCNYPFCKGVLRFHSSVTKNVTIRCSLRGTAGKQLPFVMSKYRKLKLSRQMITPNRMRCSRLPGKYRKQRLCNLRDISQNEKDLFFTLYEKRRKTGHSQAFFLSFKFPIFFL